MDIEELRKKAEDTTRRGKPIEFADGKTWVIPTMNLKLKNPRIDELYQKAIAKTISSEESVEFVEAIVKMNYPDAHTDDINPDLEAMRDTIMQYTGQFLGN